MLITMDKKHLKRLQSRLKLEKKQKQTVEALRRQLSTHSTSTSSTGEDCVAKLTGREVVLLRKVVQTLTTFTADSDSIKYNVDSRRVDKNQSVESFFSSTRGSVNYDNAARFYVRIKKEELRTVKQVCLEFNDEDLNKNPATKENEQVQVNSKHSSLNEYDHDYKANYGYSVAVTQQNLSSERPIATNETMTGALPEDRTSDENVYEAGDKNQLSFRRAVFLVMDRDLSERWRKRGNATWFGVFFSIVAMAAFFADIVTDLKVAADHYTAGSNWWASFTLSLVLLPLVVTNLVSFFWHKEDEQIHVDKHIAERPQSGWKTVSVTHFILLGGLVER